MNLHFILRDIKSYVTGLKKIISEIALDDVSAITAADHEIVDTGCRVNLHDVPKNGFASDLNHRLRSEITLLANSRAHTSRKYYGLQGLLFVLSAEACNEAMCRRPPGQIARSRNDPQPTLFSTLRTLQDQLSPVYLPNFR